MEGASTFAVETNFLLERAHNYAGTEWERLSAPNGIITLSVLGELAQIIANPEDAYARDAAHRVCEQFQDWGLTAKNLSSNDIRLRNEVVASMVELDIVKGPVTASQIVAEAAILRCAYLLADRHCIIEIDENLLGRVLAQHDLCPLEILY
jgi:hypothetical protein